HLRPPGAPAAAANQGWARVVLSSLARREATPPELVGAGSEDRQPPRDLQRYAGAQLGATARREAKGNIHDME
ncbi:hypothetical protein LTR53_010732, partial [Teratosphaeriaceae sp. CCFEE 6253]